MLKARAGKLVIIGLSDLNLQRLCEGKPITFDGAELLFPGTQFLIMHGATPQNIVEALRARGFEGISDVAPEKNA